MNKIKHEDLIAFHPGYYINEIIEELGMSLAELTRRLDITENTVRQLIDGEINLTWEISSKLNNIFGISTDMWVNLNKSYIEKRQEIEEKKKASKHRINFP